MELFIKRASSKSEGVELEISAVTHNGQFDMRYLVKTADVNHAVEVAREDLAAFFAQASENLKLHGFRVLLRTPEPSPLTGGFQTQVLPSLRPGR